MPDDVIRRVNEMERKAKVNDGVIFSRKDDTILVDAPTPKPTPEK